MPSLIDRVANFGRSPKGQSLVRQAMSRFSGGDTRKGGRRATTRRGGTRRSAGGGRARTMRKR